MKVLIITFIFVNKYERQQCLLWKVWCKLLSFHSEEMPCNLNSEYIVVIESSTLEWTITIFVLRNNSYEYLNFIMSIKVFSKIVEIGYYLTRTKYWSQLDIEALYIKKNPIFCPSFLTNLIVSHRHDTCERMLSLEN